MSVKQNKSMKNAIKKLYIWWKNKPTLIQECEIKPRKTTKWVAVHYSKEAREVAKEKPWYIKIVYPVFCLIDNWFSNDKFTGIYQNNCYSTTIAESEPMDRESAENWGKSNYDQFYLKSV